MKVRLLIINILFPLLSYSQTENEVSKGLFIGRSVYFWILVFAMVYLGYSYYKSQERKLFFKNPFILSITLCTGLLLFGFLFNNLFFHEVKKKIHYSEVEEDISELLKKDDRYKEQLENNFLDLDLNYNYISNHFKIPQLYKQRGEEVERDDYTISNFYYNRLDFSDRKYVEVSKLFLGIFFYKKNELEESKLYLGELKQSSNSYFNYYYGKTLLKSEDTTSAISYFLKGIKIEKVLKQDCYHQLIKILEAKQDYATLSTILYSDEGKQFVPYEISKRIYFDKFDIANYYFIVLKNAFRNFNWTAFVAALLVMIIWLVYILRLDVFEKEHFGLVILILVYGMGFTFLSFYLYDFLDYKLNFSRNGEVINDLLYCIFGIGLIEEFVKLVPLIIIFFLFKDHLDEAYDYVLYACVSALGFAFIENIFYFGSSLDGTVQGRALTSVPGHMIDTSIAAYGFVISQYRYKKFPLYLSVPVFFILACISHGLYDFFLFYHLLPLFLFVFLLSISIWVIIINNCINNSPHFSYRLKFSSSNLQVFMTVAFTFILVLQYLITGWEKGPKLSNEAFTVELFFSGFFIIYYTDRLTNMDMVKGYWNSISFRSIEEKRNNYPFNMRLFFIRLISGDIIPHRFVGRKITIKADRQNIPLRQFFSDIVTGDITDRIVVSCVAPVTGEEYKDPYWFRIKTGASINTGTKEEFHFFIRFEDDKPNFKNPLGITANLYTFKEDEKEEIHRNDLRSLGKVVIMNL